MREKTTLQRKTKKRRPHSMDYSIIFLVLVLVVIGLVMVYSTSSYKAGLYDIYNNDPAYFLKRQAFYAAVGVVGMLVLSKFDYNLFRKKLWFSYAYYIVILAALAYTAFFASDTNGSKRWIGVGGIRIQPSEVAKIVLILVLAAFISRNAREMRTLKGIAKAFLLAIPIILLVGIENLSTCIIITLIVGVMIFVSTPLWKPFFAAIGAAGVMFAILLVKESYRLERIQAWLHPEADDNGMQTLQGFYAIGSGGLFGKGLGQSMQKMGFIPEVHTDMIFSIVCEELGLFGAVCIIILYAVLIWRLVIIAVNAADIYGSLIVAGVITHIGMQVFVNIGVVTGLVPNTGVPLPFISYGGTSLLFLLLEVGIALSVSKYMRIQE